jgi:hypothetical protein
MMGHCVDRRLCRVDRMNDRLVEEAIHQHVDAVVEGGRKQQPLTTGRCGVHNPSDDG